MEDAQPQTIRDILNWLENQGMILSENLPQVTGVKV